VSLQFSGGKQLLDDLPREAVADDAELSAVVESSAGSKRDNQP
jgi:hypothetical protein